MEERNWNAMKIGFTELILVVIVAFVVIGPDKLPEYARKFGKMLRELKSTPVPLRRRSRRTWSSR